ncbi:MAG TPA: HoxN/HupN/NixA family nickel/cobalt transporter [Casimicrobiaceae bacterium]|nr:HoxN/HupN/NixA family nickel/cobalt transporter [Casimicrobiaceae bacterium]
MGPSYRVVTGSTVVARPRAAVPAFSRSEWMRLSGLYGVIALLHVTGWGFYLYYSTSHPALVGLGFVAYVLGLRHAFDADHIAAVDDTVRYMLQKGKRPLGIGFFFSLGHSTIVLALAIGIMLAATLVSDTLPTWRNLGGIIGTGVSGSFLWAIGIMNLVVLVGTLKAWRQASIGKHSHDHLEGLLARRGLMNRIFGERLNLLINHSWQMYPLGVLFGLGFDTASEIGFLAVTAGAATGNLPVAAVLSLPILFAAGMSAMDTTDGILMTKAYDWAFVNPLRKIFYNITITSLSVVVALALGTVELLQVLIRLLHLGGPFVDYIGQLDFGALGYGIVGIFLVTWAVSWTLWRCGRYEERYRHLHPPHTHPHVHDYGVSHAHRHFH